VIALHALLRLAMERLYKIWCF